MGWTNAQPQATHSDRERLNFSRELWTRIHFAQIVWTPQLVPSYTAMDTQFFDGSPDVSTKAAVGLRPSMEIKVNPPTQLPAGFTVDALCTVNDQMTIRIQNLSGVDATPPAGSWAFCGVVI